MAVHLSLLLDVLPACCCCMLSVPFAIGGSSRHCLSVSIAEALCFGVSAPLLKVFALSGTRCWLARGVFCATYTFARCMDGL